MYCDLVIVRVD